MITIKLELNFPGQLKNEPLICEVCKRFTVVMNIIEASFSTEIGWAVIVLEGEKEQLDNAIQYLTQKGVAVRELRESS